MAQTNMEIYDSMSISKDPIAATSNQLTAAVNNTVPAETSSQSVNVIVTPVNNNNKNTNTNTTTNNNRNNSNNNNVLSNSFIMSETNNSLDVEPLMIWSNGDDVMDIPETAATVSRKRHVNNDYYQQHPVTAVERQIIQRVVNETTKDPNDDDENFLFLKSLLPYLRDVPKHRKLAVRIKLQKVFIEEQEKHCYVYNANAANAANAAVAAAAAAAAGWKQTNYYYQAPVNANLQQRPPPPPYENYKHNLIVPPIGVAATATSMPIQSSPCVVKQQPTNSDFTVFQKPLQPQFMTTAVNNNSSSNNKIKNSGKKKINNNGGVDITSASTTVAGNVTEQPWYANYNVPTTWSG